MELRQTRIKSTQIKMDFNRCKNYTKIDKNQINANGNDNIINIMIMKKINTKKLRE